MPIEIIFLHAILILGGIYLLVIGILIVAQKRRIIDIFNTLVLKTFDFLLQASKKESLLEHSRQTTDYRVNGIFYIFFGLVMLFWAIISLKEFYLGY